MSKSNSTVIRVHVLAASSKKTTERVYELCIDHSSFLRDPSYPCAVHRLSRVVLSVLIKSLFVGWLKTHLP